MFRLLVLKENEVKFCILTHTLPRHCLDDLLYPLQASKRRQSHCKVGREAQSQNTLLNKHRD